MVSKTYFNCVPLVDDAPTFYDGNGFEFYNGTHETVYLALEANAVRQKNIFGQFDDLTDFVLGAGTYDPSTVVRVRPNEKITLWDKSKNCGEPNVRCDGQEGREIVMLRQDNESMPKTYRFDISEKDFAYNPAVCCVEYNPPAVPCDCNCGGEINTTTCQ